MKTYHIIRNDKQSGPYTLEEITTKFTAGELSRDDLCWTEGMAEWAPIQGVLPVGSATPPPPKPPSPYTPSPVATSAVGRSRPRLILMGFLWSVVINCIGGILIVAVVIAAGAKDAAETPTALKGTVAVLIILTLLSPLLVVWMTVKGFLPGTRKP